MKRDNSYCKNMDMSRVMTMCAILVLWGFISLHTSTKTINGDVWLRPGQEECVYLPFNPSKTSVRLTYLPLATSVEYTTATQSLNPTYINQPFVIPTTVYSEPLLYKTEYVTIANDVSDKIIIKYEIETRTLNVYEYIYYDHQYLFYAIVIIGTVLTQACAKYYK